jgi:hypothetical protein
MIPVLKISISLFLMGVSLVHYITGSPKVRNGTPVPALHHTSAWRPYLVKPGTTLLFTHVAAYRKMRNVVIDLNRRVRYLLRSLEV